ncbi:MAG: 12-oxophytodienoate reductase [Alphaproteobacteria bacterium]|nr:12-oxophytodienoate reductase [Alphaproteobacteria bacterium]
MSSTTDPLFTPLSVGNLTLRNRLVMSPMTRGFSPDGVPPEFAPDYYGRRAENEIGLIVTEGIGVDHPAALGDSTGTGWDYPDLHGDAALAGWKKVVDRVHAAGSAIFPQLWHHGGLRLEGTGRHPEAISVRPSGNWGPEPGPFQPPHYREQITTMTRPITESEIADLIAGFARSAANAMKVGFDGIALHGAHGYMIDTFFWDVTNQRTDRWGGPSLRERAAFGVELVKAVRAEAGNTPIMFRFSQWKLHDYDAYLAETPQELEELLGPLTDAGVDIFDASTRKFAVPAFDGSPLTLAGWAKKITGKPTMAVGGVTLATDLQSSFIDGSPAEDNLPAVRERIAGGEFDLIGIGRSLLTNPDWGTRVRLGQPLKSFKPEDNGTQV